MQPHGRPARFGRAPVARLHEARPAAGDHAVPGLYQSPCDFFRLTVQGVFRPGSGRTEDGNAGRQGGKRVNSLDHLRHDAEKTPGFLSGKGINDILLRRAGHGTSWNILLLKVSADRNPMFRSAAGFTRRRSAALAGKLRRHRTGNVRTASPWEDAAESGTLSPGAARERIDEVPAQAPRRRFLKAFSACQPSSCRRSSTRRNRLPLVKEPSLRRRPAFMPVSSSRASLMCETG